MEYLGHCISGQCLQPTNEKVQVIHNAPPPTNISCLKSFLGLLNYYCFSPTYQVPWLLSTSYSRRIQCGFGVQLSSEKALSSVYWFIMTPARNSFLLVMPLHMVLELSCLTMVVTNQLPLHLALWLPLRKSILSWIRKHWLSSLVLKQFHKYLYVLVILFVVSTIFVRI